MAVSLTNTNFSYRDFNAVVNREAPSIMDYMHIGTLFDPILSDFLSTVVGKSQDTNMQFLLHSIPIDNSSFYLPLANKYNLKRPRDIHRFITLFHDQTITMLQKTDDILIDDNTIRSMIISDKRHLYLANKEKYLLASNSALWKSRYGRLKKIKIGKAFVKFGIDAVYEATESGVATL